MGDSLSHLDNILVSSISHYLALHMRFVLLFQYQDEDGMTPLMAAVDKDHLATAAFLLKEVSEPNRSSVPIYLSLP